MSWIRNCLDEGLPMSVKSDAVMEIDMGARRNFSRGGQSHRHFKKSTRIRRAVQNIDHFSAHRRRKRKILRFFAAF